MNTQPSLTLVVNGCESVITAGRIIETAASLLSYERHMQSGDQVILEVTTDLPDEGSVLLDQFLTSVSQRAHTRIDTIEQDQASPNWRRYTLIVQ